MSFCTMNGMTNTVSTNCPNYLYLQVPMFLISVLVLHKQQFHLLSRMEDHILVVLVMIQASRYQSE